MSTAAAAPSGPRGPRRRAVAAVACAAIAALVLLSACGSDASEPSTAPSRDQLATAEVARADLRRTTSIDGTLGYGPEREFASPASGMLTSAPTVGVVIERGDELWRIDGRPTVLFLGDTPLWRELSPLSPPNSDIRVLKQNLQALGYFDGLYYRDSDTFDEATTLAVTRWQKALGIEPSGAVALGTAVVSPQSVRVASIAVQVGSAVSGKVLGVTGDQKVVTAKAKSQQLSELQVGTQVAVVLDGATKVPGKVIAIAPTTESGAGAEGGAGVGGGSGGGTVGGGGDKTTDIYIAVDDPSLVAEEEPGPVSVEVTAESVDDVLTVPVGALVALREGGFAVQLSDGKYVAVTPGVYADGIVQIDGKLREGDKVVTTR